jgi:predicted acyltransferase
MSPTAGALQARPRIESLDAFRGLTIFLMVFVIAVAGYHDLPQKGSWCNSLPVSTWHHAEVGWEQFAEARQAEGMNDAEITSLPETRLRNVGVTITDLVAPFFVFIVGVAIPLSRARRGPEWWRHVLVRSGMLILAGVVYISLIFGLSWWWGILQAIGVAYFMGAASMKLAPRSRVIAIGMLLLLHGFLSYNVDWWLHFGETNAPFWTAANPTGSWMKPLTIHCRPWVSISYGVMTMIGVMVGEAVASGERRRITTEALVIGLSCIIGGYLTHIIGLVTNHADLCFSKPDVTSSYALFTSGIGALLFLLMYYVIDVWKIRRWAYPLTEFGKNALLAYFMQILMRLAFRALGIEPFFAGHANPTLTSWAGLYDATWWHSFLLDKSGYNGILWGLLWTACLWGIIRICNRKGLYWKL